MMCAPDVTPVGALAASIKAIAVGRAQPHTAAMNPDVPYPYSVTIEPSKKAEGQHGWLLRRSGKLIERSDRLFTSEAKAHENALRAIEIDVRGGFVGRR